jgi:uncharacterized membrane protein YeaQ/YmgE (transglycosylase-associated protein family)
MGRISRSFQLVGQSYRILMQDKELMVLPLISGAIILVVFLSFFVGFGLPSGRIDSYGAGTYLPLFVMYVVVYAIAIFFQAAVIAGATERMRGGNPTVGSALAAAGRRLDPILLWAVVAGTVGVVPRAIQDRVGFIGKIVVGLVGTAWSLATLFVVPVLVLEDRTTGESFVGGTSLGLASVCAWATLIATTGLSACGRLRSTVSGQLRERHRRRELRSSRRARSEHRAPIDPLRGLVVVDSGGASLGLGPQRADGRWHVRGRQGAARRHRRRSGLAPPATGHPRRGRALQYRNRL